MDTLSFFDLKTLFFSELIGDIWLGILVGCILITFFSLKNKIPYEVVILANVEWILIVYAAFTGFTLLYILVVLLAAFYFYYQISKIVRRG